MNGAFYIGATGLDAQQRALDVVANNIANINTPAFKRSAAQFSALVAGSPTTDSDIGLSGEAPLLGVSVATSPFDLTPGQLTQTSNPMSLAISGSGFIELAGPGGQTLLWRGGTLEVNTDGFLAASNGMALKSMISVPTDAASVTVQPDGSVLAVTSSGSSSSIGTIDIAQIKDPSTLSEVQSGLYAVDNQNQLRVGAPGANGSGMLAQGYAEASNVDLNSEMTTLLLMQRAFGANAQVVQAGDQLMAIANSLRR